jgi:transposase
LGRHRPELDLSSVDLDNSHTTAIRGGDKVEYQGQKKRKTTNALYLTDRQGLYDLRYAIERTNAWMDTFRSLLNRFDTTTESWKGLNYLAFMVMALKKFERNKLEKV